VTAIDLKVSTKYEVIYKGKGELKIIEIQDRINQTLFYHIIGTPFRQSHTFIEFDKYFKVIKEIT